MEQVGQGVPGELKQLVVGDRRDRGRVRTGNPNQGSLQTEFDPVLGFEKSGVR
jgi:hypothetical protein